VRIFFLSFLSFFFLFCFMMAGDRDAMMEGGRKLFSAGHTNSQFYDV